MFCGETPFGAGSIQNLLGGSIGKTRRYVYEKN